MRVVCLITDKTEHCLLEDVASKDHLTGIYNRRSFDEILAKEIHRNYRENKTLTLLMIDLDNFKSLNDNFGHVAGDEALKMIAAFLQQHTRAYDHLARWGGDEFVMLCPDLSAVDSLNYAERIRADFENQNFPYDYNLSLSIGIASTNNDNPMLDSDLLNCADKAVYVAKESGRNQVRHFDLIADNSGRELV